MPTCSRRWGPNLAFESCNSSCPPIPMGSLSGKYRKNSTFPTQRCRTIWISSGTKSWCRYAARARSFTTQPTLRRFRNCSSSCTPNVARAIRLSSQSKSFRSVDKGEQHEQREHKGSGQGKVRRSGSSREERWQFVLWGCFEHWQLRSNYLQPLRQLTSRADSRGSAACVARLRQPNRASKTESR